MTLRVAVPNKGQLSEPARAMLREAGYLRSAGQRELMIHDPDNDVDFFFLRPKDIATYVGQGTLNLGICGRDMLVDSGAPVTEVIELGFGHSTFRLAAPQGASVDGKRIATSYPGLLKDWLERTGTEATMVRLDGAVENAVGLGVADAVADVVDTGNTLRQAGLSVIGEPLLVSQALLVRPAGNGDASPPEQTFVRRLQGVIVARAYVMVEYDISEDLLERATAITPGLEAPTVAPLSKPGWFAVRAMVERARVHQVMDELFNLGGRAILVTDIHACRL